MMVWIHGPREREQDVGILIRLGRDRKGKKLSSPKWQSPTDSDVRIGNRKAGNAQSDRQAGACAGARPGAVVATELRVACRRSTAMLSLTLNRAERHLVPAEELPTPKAPAEPVANKSYYPRAMLEEVAV